MRASLYRPRRLRALRVACTVILVPACHSDEARYRVSTRNFDIYIHDGATPLCRGEYTKLDDIFEASQEAFGLNRESEKIPVHLWSDQAELPCASMDAAGCFMLPEVEVHAWSEGGAIHHELVHAATGSAIHLDNLFFSEGVAEGISALIPPQALDFDPRPLFSSDNFDYLHAAVFVSYVMEEYGDAAAFRVFSRVPEDGLEVFATVLGRSIDEIAQDFMATEIKCGTQIARCRGAATTFDGEWAYQELVSCGYEHAQGVIGETPIVETLLEFDSMETIDFRVTHGEMYMERCAPCADRYANRFYSGQHIQHDIPPGTYYVALTGDQLGSELNITLDRVAP